MVWTSNATASGQPCDPDLLNDNLEYLKARLIEGDDGKNYKVVACVLRQTTAGGGWNIINDSGHAPIGIDLNNPVTENVDGTLTINYDFTASKVGSLIVSPDETFARLGVFCGASVGSSSAVISLAKDLECLVNLATVTTTGTTVDADSASGQKVLNVAATTGIPSGTYILINPNGAKEELAKVASVQAGVSVTLETNLTYTHTASDADVVKLFSTTGVATNTLRTGDILAADNGDGSVTICHPNAAIPSANNMPIISPNNASATFVSTVDVRGYSVSTDKFKLAPYMNFSGYIAYVGTTTSTVNADSASGQKVLNVAATTGFVVGDSVIINKGGAREENGQIASIQAGVSLTLVSNLTNTHLASEADTVRVDWKLTTNCKNKPFIYWSTDHLIVSHESLISAFGVNIGGRSGGHLPQIDSVSITSYTVYFYNYAGAKVSTAGADMKFHYLNPDKVAYGTKTGSANCLRLQGKLDASKVYSSSGNLWVYGIMEV